jgi:hypothetical protein
MTKLFVLYLEEKNLKYLGDLDIDYRRLQRNLAQFDAPYFITN